MGLTTEQKSCVEERGRSLLVSAAAGSGKTKVLTERLIRYIVDEGADISTFVVITFTKAAAAELKSRIYSNLTRKLTEIIENNPADPSIGRLRRQISACYSAKISTIHSFCGDLLRSYIHDLPGNTDIKISPGFRIMDSVESGALKGTVLKGLLEKRYEKLRLAEEKGPLTGRDAAFRVLADTLGDMSSGIGDDDIETACLALLNVFESHPDRRLWEEKIKEFYSEAFSVSDLFATVWGDELRSRAAETILACADNMETLLGKINTCGSEAVIKAFENLTYANDNIKALYEKLSSCTWDEFIKEPEKVYRKPDGKGIMISKPKKAEPWELDIFEALKDESTEIRETINDLKDIFTAPSENLIRDLRLSYAPIEELIALSEDFAAEFAEAKALRSALDYSDLEHLTLKLLIDPETGKPGELAKKIASRYTEIMVDEYQDVNEVQNTIFNAISKDGKNLFTVGDMKQSIYRFRMADPGIFQEKYSFLPKLSEAEPGESAKIFLSRNFRSRSVIIDFANMLFERVMSLKVGEIEYDEDSRLVFGASAYAPGYDLPCEIIGIDNTGTGDDAAAEAIFVADKIATMLSERDESGNRKYTESDFAIILRSRTNASAFASALLDKGIRVASAEGGSFFMSFEVSLLIGLMSLIDTPRDDVRLISVLSSRVFGFSPDDLAKIREEKRGTDFYTALCIHAAKGDRRSKDFIEKLSSWRKIAPDVSSAEMLSVLVSDLDLFSLCAAGDNSETRLSNIDVLISLARSFSDAGSGSVHGFVLKINELILSGNIAETGSAEAGVTIMTMHKSKGLQFRCVFLCSLQRQFNFQDEKSKLITHKNLGIGVKALNKEKGTITDTIARFAIGKALHAEQLSEEMRILYVAVTRAEERLFMTFTESQKTRSITSPTPGKAVPTALTSDCKSYAEWLLLACIGNESMGGRTIFSLNRFPLTDTDKSGAENEEGALSAPPEAQENTGDNTDISEEMAIIKGSLDFVYPYEAEDFIPAKVSATSLKGFYRPDIEAKEFFKDDEYSEEDEERLRARGVLTKPAYSAKRPDFSKEAGLTAAERGTATHGFLYSSSFCALSRENGIEEEKKRLLALGTFTEEELNVVNDKAISALAKGPLGERLIAAEKEGRLYKEYRFTVLVPALSLFPNAPAEETILLQGAADCFFIEDDGIVLIDYKTDKVFSREKIRERLREHKKQLEIYSYALSEIFSMPVKEKYISFLSPGLTLRLKNEET
ncbi:MAG: UvrD-helicase domain-containing protein [Oscillospiraceae bacterium]|nr:UvrD-helicase domain-containing protein [Oscillospiraceae bacterium]